MLQEEECYVISRREDPLKRHAVERFIMPFEYNLTTILERMDQVLNQLLIHLYTFNDDDKLSIQEFKVKRVLKYWFELGINRET